MRLEQLQYVIEIANCHSITIAAKNLYISQPALSRAVKALEEELGFPLFFRTISGINLTRYGELLLPQMQFILDQTQSLLQQSQVLLQKSQDFLNAYSDIVIPTSLTIQALPTISDSLLLPALEMFSESFPMININVLPLNIGDLSTLPDMNDSDLTLFMNVNEIFDHAINKSNLHAEILFTDTFYIVVSKTHELAQKNTVSLNKVLQYKLIVHDNGFKTEAYYRELTNCPDKLNVILKSNNPRVITQLILRQNVILLTNNLLIKSDYLQNENLKFIPIRNVLSHYIGLYDMQSPYLGTIKELIKMLKLVHNNAFSL